MQTLHVILELPNIKLCKEKHGTEFNIMTEEEKIVHVCLYSHITVHTTNNYLKMLLAFHCHWH